MAALVTSETEPGTWVLTPRFRPLHPSTTSPSPSPPLRRRHLRDFHRWPPQPRRRKINRTINNISKPFSTLQTRDDCWTSIIINPPGLQIHSTVLHTFIVYNKINCMFEMLFHEVFLVCQFLFFTEHTFRTSTGQQWGNIREHLIWTCEEQQWRLLSTPPPSHQRTITSTTSHQCWN